MLDIKFIREHADLVAHNAQAKGMTVDVKHLLALDEKHRQLLQEVEELKRKRNEANDTIGRLKQEGSEATAIITSMKAISQKINEIDGKVGEVYNKIAEIMINIPNIVDNSVTKMADARGNRVVREWGIRPSFNFNPKNHLELAEALGWLSLERGAKITGSAFVVYQGKGAHLERALINLMLDLHTTQHGYTEVSPPFLVNRASMTGTGQLPKLEEDMYRLKDEDFFLIPTAEVPVTNIHRDEILQEAMLPLSYVAYTPCFRREAGSYGKETRGLARVHQFDKVELVKFTRPQDSDAALDVLVSHAERVLQLLELPYRVVLLASGDTSFAAAKCYDLEVWAPATGKWFEVSSCSTFRDFQARRINIKYQPEGRGKPQLVHTLNGSGVALARTMLCLLENHQQQDGSIALPKTLEPYMQ